MKKLSLLLLAAGIFCSSCQQAPRPIIQTEVPMYTTKEVTIQPKRKKRAAKTRRITECSMVTVSGPVAKEWDLFDRTDATMKYNEIPIKDKEVLFETVARVYANLPKNNTHSCEASRNRTRSGWSRRSTSCWLRQKASPMWTLSACITLAA